MNLDVKLSETHMNSSIKLIQGKIIRNTHQNASLQTLFKYNEQSVFFCDQKCHFTTNKGIVTMKCNRDVLNNALTLRNGQGLLKHVE